MAAANALNDNAERPQRPSTGSRGICGDPNATGAPDPLPGPGSPGRETHERQAAYMRGSKETAERATSVAVQSEALAALRAHGVFELLGENVRDYAIFLLDVSGIIRHWGEGARLMKWWTRRQVLGAHLRMLYPDGGSDDGTAEEHLQTAAEVGEYTGEGLRVRSDSSTLWAGVTVTALRGADGTVVGFTKVTRDLSSRRAIDAALKSAKAAIVEGAVIAEEAQRLRNLFVASVSHEIRTPLNAMLGYLSMLDQESDDRDRVRAHIKRIGTNAAHLLEIVNDLLDVSRLESGRFLVTLASDRIGRAIEAALTDVRPQAAAKGVDILDAVSGYAAEMPYWGDQARVRQILVNLIANALKFTTSGGRVTVSAGSAETASPQSIAANAGPWVYIRVEDTGEGIPVDSLEAVFEPYIQATARDAHTGTGLGLSISRRLARLMGGDLTLQSDVGVGSTFILWLPIAPSDPG